MVAFSLAFAEHHVKDDMRWWGESQPLQPFGVLVKIYTLRTHLDLLIGVSRGQTQ